jgi:hypothetical protein
LSNNLDKKDGKEHFDVFEPLEKKPKRSYKKTCVFQNTWACHFPWQSLLLGAMAWSFRFGAPYVASLKENKIVIS